MARAAVTRAGVAGERERQGRAEGSGRRGRAAAREVEEHSWPRRAVATEPPGPAGEAVRGAARGGGGAERRARGGACGPAERVRGASWPLEGGAGRETPFAIPTTWSERGQRLPSQGHREGQRRGGPWPLGLGIFAVPCVRHLLVQAGPLHRVSTQTKKWRFRNSGGKTSLAGPQFAQV